MKIIQSKLWLKEIIFRCKECGGRTRLDSNFRINVDGVMLNGTRGELEELCNAFVRKAFGYMA